MFRNYLVAALRNLARNRLYAAINVVGMAVGFAAAILIALYVRDELSYDKWIPGHERIYLIAEKYFPPGRAPLTYPVTFEADAEWLKADFPAVETAVRVIHSGLALRRKEIEGTEETGAWVDPDFFKVFPLPVIAGNLSTALDQPDGIVLTRSMARKYFGRDTPIGETIEIGRQHPMRVTAILEDLPSNTSLNVEIFASGHAAFSELTVLDAVQFSSNQTQSENSYTYVKLAPGRSASEITRALPAFLDRHLPKGLAARQLGLTQYLVPIDAIHLNPSLTLDGKSASDFNTLLALSAVGALIVFAASLNFINLMTARANRRATEVGARKAVGARRGDIIRQFVGESLLYIVLSTVVALMLAELLLPSLNAFLQRTIAFDYWRDPTLAGGLAILVVVVGALAGLYPAIVLSSFTPATVLKSAATSDPLSGWIRQGLVVLQFAILIGLTVTTGVIYRQTNFGMHEHLRLPGDQILLIQTRCTPAFVDRVQTLAGVRDVTCASQSALNYGRIGTVATRSNGTTDASIRLAPIGFGFLEQFDLEPLAGRTFSRNHPADSLPEADDGVAEPPIVINETAMRQLGFSSPQAAIGQVVSWNRFFGLTNKLTASLPSEIIGVVPDFSLASVRNSVEPTFYYVSPGQLVDVSVKLSGQDLPATLAAIDRAWMETAARTGPIQRTFLDRRMQNLYLDVIRQSQIFAAFAGVALFVACLGLLGLSAYTSERRTKEIGIRKSMGAKTGDILRLLTWEFAKPVLWANLIAWPIAYYFMNRWLNGFAYHIDLVPWMFLSAGALALVIALVSVSVLSLITARAKPIEALRYE